MAAIRTVKLGIPNADYFRDYQRWLTKMLKRGKRGKKIGRLGRSMPKRPKMPRRFFYQIVATTEEEAYGGITDFTKPKFTPKGDLFVFEPEQNADYLMSRIQEMDVDPQVKEDIWNGYLGLARSLRTLGWKIPRLELGEVYDEHGNVIEALKGKKGRTFATAGEMEGDSAGLEKKGFEWLFQTLNTYSPEIAPGVHVGGHFLPYIQFIKLVWLPFFVLGGSFEKDPRRTPYELGAEPSLRLQMARSGIFPAKITLKGTTKVKAGSKKLSGVKRLGAVARIYGITLDTHATAKDWYRAPTLTIPKQEVWQQVPEEEWYQETKLGVIKLLEDMAEERSALDIDWSNLENYIRIEAERVKIDIDLPSFMARLKKDLDPNL